MNYIWKISSQPETYDLTAIVQQLLSNRGFKDASEQENFLNPKHPNTYTLQDLGVSEKAIEKVFKRLEIAKKNNEPIIIYGDYDVDGITSTAILWETLHNLGFTVMPFIPHREKHGYGLKVIGIDGAIEQYGKPKLIMTVDNAIVAFDGAKYCKELGIDLIISDHHQADTKYPESYAVIHSTIVSGAGVSYFLSRAIAQHFGGKDLENENLFELAAMGTIADIMPLVGINRSLVKYGLSSLTKTSRVGIQSLFECACLEEGQEINTYHVGFILGPRINASGRLGSGMDSLRLLCTTNKDKAKNLAQSLNDTNKERQDLTFSGVEESIESFAKKTQIPKVLISSSKDFNPGIIGLISGKLTEHFYRPAITIAILSDIEAKGSVRSIKGINIIELLREFSHLFIDLGGHPLAAGFSIHPDKIADLEIGLLARIEEIASEEILQRKMHIEMALPMSVLNLELYDALQKFAPFGMQNSTPTFASFKVCLNNVQMVGKQKAHARITLKDLENPEKKIPAIFFSVGKEFEQFKVGDIVNVAYQIQLNEWKGKQSLQLVIKDMVLG